MTPIKNVVLAGTSGAVAPAILEQLVKSGQFNVTAFTRDPSKGSYPDSVKVVKADYSSVEALTEALKGQDAVVSSLHAAATDEQFRLAEASIAAGVKRFLPSEFGVDTINPKSRALPVFGGKVKLQEYLKKKAAEGAITYTLVFTGSFFDWALGVGFIINTKERKVELYDGGENQFSATTVAGVGKAIVGVLTHYEETKNRAVAIQEALVSQKQLLKIAQKITNTTDDQWEIKVTETAPLEEAAYEELKKESPNALLWIYNLIKRAVFAEGYGGRFDKVDNELLGLKEFTDDDLEALVAKYAQ
ncbi:MAG: hypothetical protein M1816_004969 [Peltula sp. TS41687]|nr:MAG: hypothetical protein M1816_004969 [Peltula sp. TS41687]